jgi:hypothetical protein
MATHAPRGDGWWGTRLQQLGGELLFAGKHYSILAQNAHGGTSVADGLHGILDLVETPYDHT